MYYAYEICIMRIEYALCVYNGYYTYRVCIMRIRYILYVKNTYYAPADD